MNKPYYVYRLISPSGKSYIGQTRQGIFVRLKQHITSWKKWAKDGRKRKSYQTKLFYAFDKYDPEMWIVQELQTTVDKHSCNYLEISYIKLFDTVSNGYNIQLGGHGWTSDVISQDHKDNISKGRTEWFKTPEGLAWKKDLAAQRKGVLGHKKGTPTWNKGIKMSELHPGAWKNNGMRSVEQRQEARQRALKNWAEGKFANRPKPSKESVEKRVSQLRGKTYKKKGAEAPNLV
jgi:hypothetical protein